MAFYGLFCISNLAPVSAKFFDKTQHLLCLDIIFAYPGVHVKVKWTKNIQAPERQHLIRIPTVQDCLMCPVKTLSQLFWKFHLQPQDPLFVLDEYHLLTQSHLRSCLSTFLCSMEVPLEGHGFHTFCQSAATIAYDACASLTTIKSHGL